MYRKIDIPITKNELKNLYLDQGMSMQKIADKLGLPTKGSLQRLMSEWNIPRRKGKFQKGNTANPNCKVNLVGKKFNRLTAISLVPRVRKGSHKMYRCLCDCGNFTVIQSSALSGGYIKSCGCLQKEFTQEHKDRIGAAHKGHTRNCGSGNWNWQGGIGIEPYCDAWADKEYKADIKERDESMCMNPDCWNTSETLCLHHIDYDKKNCSPSNLITLCASCNARANFSRENHTIYYQDLMTEFYGYEYEQQLSLLEAVNQ